MKGNLKKSLSIFGALSFAFTAGFLLSNVNVCAATNQTLELNKDYYFDLNGDGQTGLDELRDGRIFGDIVADTQIAPEHIAHIAEELDIDGLVKAVLCI